jgi:uncharacterized membrane protein YphA (DoxX/SURF4 family)
MKKLICLLTALTLFWSAYAKATMPTGGPTLFDAWVDQFPILRWLFPTVEVGLALWLLSGLLPRWSAIVAICTFASFSGLLASEIAKSHPKPCGCMGAAAALYEPTAIRRELALGLGRNALLMAGAAYLFLSVRRPPAGPALKTPPAPSANPFIPTTT